MTKGVTDYLLGVREGLARAPIGDLTKAAEILIDTWQTGDRVWVLGNGGSAATAQHFALDLMKWGGAGVKAQALGDLPALTAYANDGGYANALADMFEVLASPHDVLVIISCSGQSANVLEVARRFLRMRMGSVQAFKPPGEGSMIFMTGPLLPDVLKRRHDVILRAEADDIRQQEDIHMAYCHFLAGEVARAKQEEAEAKAMANA